MKNINLGLCAIVIALFGIFLVQSSPVNNGRLLGAKQCTWGPSFWCKNLTNAKGCNAVRHCIQTVWESQAVPQDDNGICKICKDMVTQARDQLRSNQTMDEMRQVFEGSCKLIPVKVINKECIKMVDDFIPELVEALSSQMNPDQVCTVAGLCNNARYDEMMQQAYQKAIDGHLSEENTSVEAKPKKPLLTCGNCNQLVTGMSKNFHALTHDQVLEYILRMCGQMGSFSDSCAAIAINYFDEFYEQLKNNFDAAGVCHLSGSCVAKYHQHAEDVKEVESIDLSKVEGDDIPCELCEQLVKHLRDVLIANTTETEFKQVMEGLCNQTKNFKAECLSIVDQYYEVIYSTLVNNLDANGACFMIGICPASANSPKLVGDIRPLLPVLPPAQLKVSIRKKLGANEPKFTQEDLKNMQLPIDHLMGAQNPSQLVAGGELCTICEYFLHFVQETLATPATEDEIRKTVSEICDKMGQGLKGHCHDFVDMYGDPIIALLIQGLDPRQVCPKMRICPGVQQDVEVFYPQTIVSQEGKEQPTCPLCVFAVEEAKAKIKDDTSKKTIENVLHNLCQKLPKKLQPECVDFVNTYYNELLDKLISNFTSKEICVDLKLCPKEDTYLAELGIELEKSEESEEKDDSILEEVHFASATPDCLLCEELLKLAEKRFGKHPTKESIKKKLDQTCDKLRTHMREKCHGFVVKHGDEIAALILKETEPKMVCRELGYCLANEQDDLEIDEALKYDVIAMPNEDILVKDPPTCVLCEFIMTKLEMELHNKTTQDEIKHTIEHICEVMPKTVSKSCNKFIEQYSSMILNLIGTMPPKLICQNMMLCASPKDVVITDDVIECGVCHGAVMTLLPYLKQYLDTSSVSRFDMVSVGCENLPAKYYAACSDMIEVYGQSILHLAVTDKNEATVCSEIGKCFYNEHSGLAFAKITA